MSRARDIADGTLNSADINGGNIDNTTIGGTDPAAGTFTTFTSTGIDDNLTSGGPALTIDNSGNVGVGTSSPSAKFHLATNSDGSNIPTWYEYSDANAIISNGDNGKADGYVKFQTGQYNTASTNNLDLILQSKNNNYDAGFRITAGNGTGAVTNNGYFSISRIATNGFGISATERFRIDSSGNVELKTTDANLILPFGGGISFENHSTSTATGASSTTSANVLDDYEEGTFVPTVFIDSTEVTSYYFQRGAYTKVGRIVHINLWVRVNVKGAATGAVSVQGLPFQCASGSDFMCAGTFGYQDEMASSSAPIYVYISQGTTKINLNFASSTSLTNVTDANLNNGQFMIQASYPVA